MTWSFQLLDSEDRPLGYLDGVTGGRCEIVAQSTLGGSGSMSIDDRQDIDWMSHRVRAIWSGDTTTIRHPEVGHWESGGDPVWVVDVPASTVEHPEQGHWEPGPQVWVVDTPASTVNHPAAVVYTNNGTGTTGWTFTLSPGGYASPGTARITADATTTPPSLRFDNQGTPGPSGALDPMPTITATRSLAASAGRTYTVTAFARSFHGETRASVLLGGQQSARISSTRTAVSATATASGSTIDLTLKVDDWAGTVNTVRGESRGQFDTIEVTRAAWTENIPEQGHYEPGPDVWVVDQAAWTETIPEQGHYETPKPTWVVDQAASVEVTTPSWAVGTYLFSSPTRQRTKFGVTFDVGLLTKVNIPAEDTVVNRYTLPAGTPIIAKVVQLIESTGEHRIASTPSDATLPAPLTWEAGTAKLTIINDLLQAAGYWSLWCDGSGLFRVEPYVDPAHRTPVYTFEHGENSIHYPEWDREQNMADVPNRFIAIGRGDDETPPLIGVATNTDPTSPYSYQARGRWITRTEEGVEGATQAVFDQHAARKLRELMAPVARLKVTHAMKDLNPNDVVEFIPEDGIRRVASVQRMSMAFTYDTDIEAEWREVLDA